jgi:DNA-binding PadR family transcriptional regulator
MNDIIILAMMLGGPKHGYQLKHEAGVIFGQETLHNNLVYPLLRKFLDEGWVSKKEVAGKRGQTRLQYTLTAAGRHILLERLGRFNQADAASEQAFRTRVALFDLLAADVREDILARREAYLKSRVQRLGGISAQMKLEQFAGEVVHQLRQQIELEVKWIEHLRRLARTKRRKSA